MVEIACAAALETSVGRIRTRTRTTSQVTPDIATALAERDHGGWAGAHRIDTTRVLAGSPVQACREILGLMEDQLLLLSAQLAELQRETAALRALLGGRPSC